MLKIFKLETVFLALTAVLLAATAAFFLIGDRSRGDYCLTEHVLWTGQPGVEVRMLRWAGQQININTADEEMLQTLPGIGPVLAGQIVEKRKTYGEFRIPEELISVPGIGHGKLEQILDYITVG